MVNHSYSVAIYLPESLSSQFRCYQRSCGPLGDGGPDPEWEPEVEPGSSACVMTEVKRPKSTSTEEKKEKNRRWRQLAKTNAADRQMEVILARLLSFTSHVLDVWLPNHMNVFLRNVSLRFIMPVLFMCLMEPPGSEIEMKKSSHLRSRNQQRFGIFALKWLTMNQLLK